MPEVKLKHVVSFSSEDKVHKAENLLKSETYRKWKCATPGEKNASVILQFEKATKINSIDIGNESSAFVEILVGRSSDSVNDYQVLLVASSFMSPIESRNETHTNRVRMFGSDKLSQNLKDEKWDTVQIVCTQPFNKNMTYGLSFIKFHSPSEKISEEEVQPEKKPVTKKLGAFNVKYDEDDDDSPPSIGSWLERKKKTINSSLVKAKEEESTSYASSILSSSEAKTPQSSNKRKLEPSSNDENRNKKQSPAVRVNKQKFISRDVSEAYKSEDNSKQSKDEKFGPRDIFGVKTSNPQSPSTSSAPAKKQRDTDRPKTSIAEKPKARTPFHQLMKEVVFVISGFVNPLRGEIRDKALEMGAKYKGDWDRTCTHLICAFVNTPKYVQVRKGNGKIVTKDWILECHKKRSLLPWRKYMLGRYSRDSSESSESEEEVKSPPAKKDKLANGGTVKNKDSKNVPSPKIDVESNKKLADSRKIAKKPESDSETEDEEALQDYMADTDVGSDSGNNTEDEIKKVESKMKQSSKEVKSDTDDLLFESDDDSSLLTSKPDTSDLPLPELPNLFKSKHFYLYGDFSVSTRHNLIRYINAYNGVLKDYMTDTVKYVVSEAKWDKNFDEALAENEDLIFVKPEWVLKCHEKKKLVPYQPYIIIPDS